MSACGQTERCGSLSWRVSPQHRRHKSEGCGFKSCQQHLSYVIFVEDCLHHFIGNWREMHSLYQSYCRTANADVWKSSRERERERDSGPHAVSHDPGNVFKLDDIKNYFPAFYSCLKNKFSASNFHKCCAALKSRFKASLAFSEMGIRAEL